MKKVLVSTAALVFFAGIAATAQEAAPQPPDGASIGVGQYQLTAGPIIVPTVDNNLSGISYEESTDTLYGVLNNPTVLVEMDAQGQPKRKIALRGFDDTEGVAVVGPGKIAVVEESRRNLVIMDVPAGATSVDYAKCRVCFIDPDPTQNVGLEGVSYDKAGDRYFLIKEKNPRRIYEAKVPAEPTSAPVVTNPWDVQANSLGMNDISDLYYHAATKHLLIISDESKCIVETTLDGKEISRLALKAGSVGLKEDIKQPEGVAMDKQGRIFVTSEPNTLYVFSKP